MNIWTNPPKVTSPRSEPNLPKPCSRSASAGGIASLAHPVRLREDVAALLPELCAAGLNAIEAYHSDHSPQQTELYLQLAKQHGLLVTGGSDFHGAVKPEILLGTGRGGNLKIPHNLLENLRAGQAAGSLPIHHNISAS